VFDGSTATGLAEYQSGEFIALSQGGLGASLSLGTANQILRVNSGASAVEFGSIVSTGALDSGSITSGFGAIDNGTSNIRSATITAETAFVPDSADGASLGTSSLEFSDLFLADGGTITLGNGQDITITHVADTGINIKNISTSGNSGVGAVLTLQTGDTDIAINNVLGQIDFQAPNEGAASDAVLVAASIAAVSEGDFSSSNNATKLSFKTGASEAATEKMSLSSGGNLTISGNLIIGSATVTEAQLEILDGATVTTGELNLIDGGATVGTTAIADGDGLLINDDGTMRVSTVQTLAAYLDDEITAMPNLVATGALDTGSITSGFTSIDVGAGAITTTGTTTTGLLQVDNIRINGNAITSTAGTDLTITPVSGQQIVLDGTIVVDAGVVTGATSITSTAFVGDITGDVTGTADVATVATTVTITDNESTNENNAIIFTAGGDLDGGNLGLESDGDLKYNPSTGTLSATNISVTGTLSTVDSVTMSANNAVVFEGATADAHETTLTVVDATADRTITLPNVSGTVPVLAAASNTAITSTPEELNKLDGATVVVGEINALDLGSTAVGTAIASKAVILDSSKDYTGIRNLTITGEIDAATGDYSGAVDIAGATTTAAITASGIIKTDDSTDATSTTDGSLQTDGGLSVALDTILGNDVKLLSDASVLSFGVNSEVTLTHVHNDGLLLNDDNQLQFRDSAINIRSDADGDLDINADDEIELNSTLIDINGNIDASGTYTGAGLMTTGGNIVIPNAGTIGTASDTNAMSISSIGIVSLTATNAMKLNVGTTAQRPTGAAGLIRYNSTTSGFEGYGSAWGALGGGATGGGTDAVFVENELIVTTDYTLTTNKSASMVGPLSVNSGITLSVPSGARLVVL
jgi:hypothetical protein